jgi:hypothetical protein
MKYHNKITTVDNIKFDSIAESQRYKELKLLLKAKKITNLELQPKFLLQVGFEKNGIKHRPITYIADFMYDEDSKWIVEDVKGMLTDIYKLKKKLFLYLYPNVVFREV